MRRRWKSSSGRAGSRKKVIFLVLVLSVFFSLQTFIFIEKNLRPPLMNVAKIRVKQIATQAINKAISDRISQGTNFDKLVDWKTDKNGKITGFMLNYVENMKITSGTVNVVQGILDHLQKTPEHIPLGEALNSAILASFGPNITIKFTPAGAVKVDLKTRQQDAGINMILVEVYIRIIAEVAIIIPFDTEPEMVETEIPISYLLVVGDVPMYYYDNKGNAVGGTAYSNGGTPPSIALPDLKIAPTPDGSNKSNQGTAPSNAPAPQS